jgi:predicted nucleic acid-binding protein
MPQRSILDNNRLCEHWRSSVKPKTRDQARGAARRLIDLRRTNAIVTPVKIEFLVGARSKEELELFEAFLSQFSVVDKGSILDGDWLEAERIAKRVRHDNKPRQLGDCLIRAIANRLNYAVDTADSSFPHR